MPCVSVKENLMIPHLEPAYCLDDEVYYSHHTSAVFTIDGETIYIVKNYDNYLELKKQSTITRRVCSFEPCAGLYVCTLDGSDRSTLQIHMTPEDVYYSLRFVEKAMQTQYAEVIC